MMSRPRMTLVPTLVLLVDEDPQIHQSVGRWVAEAGYECMSAISPRDARDILRAGAVPTVAILADHFREESGLKFAERMVRQDQCLGFLFLATSVSARQFESRPLGLPERILVKPLSRRSLIVALDELMLAIEATQRLTDA